MSVTPPLAYCEHGYCESEHCRTCEIMGVCKPCERASAAQGRDGRKDHQRRTGNDPHGPTGRAAGTYTPSAATAQFERASTPRCAFCGPLSAHKRGDIYLHKCACPHRTDPFCQAHPQVCDDFTDIRNEAWRTSYACSIDESAGLKDTT